MDGKITFGKIDNDDTPDGFDLREAYEASMRLICEAFKVPESVLYGHEEFSEKASCRCGWSGELSQAKREYVNSNRQSWYMLGGREGYEWLCPKCGLIIKTHYWKMS